VSGQDFITYQLSPLYPQAPAQHVLGPLVAMLRGSPASGKCP
jgi:hypothetical protein